MKSTFLLLSTLLTFLFFTNSALANDFYWVNGSGHWNDPSHWSSSLNGAGGAGIPSSNSNVFINHAGATQKLVIHFDTNISIQNLILGQAEGVVFKGRIGHVLIIQNTVQIGTQTYSASGGFVLTNNSVSYNPKQKNPVNKLITSITIDQNDLDCFGAMNGKAWIASISGSTGPFTYQWRRFSDNVIVSTTDTAKNLSGGLYSIRIADLSDNTFFGQFVNVFEPTEIGTLLFSVDETCINSCDGSVSMAISGGTPPYTFLWSNSATTQAITGLCDGQYSVIITDANGCIRHDTAYVEEPSLIQPNVSVTDVDCFGSCTGSATANPTGGNGGYVNYQWSNGQSGSSKTVSGLCDGNYSVTVTDSDGCQNSETFTISQPAAPLSATLTATDALCFGTPTGIIDVNPAGGTSPYTYAWSDGSNTSQNRSSLVAGTYTVTITDANGCIYVDSRTINEPTDISISFTGIINVDCNGNASGAATAVATGGTPPYTSYSWSSGANTATASGLSAGWHRVTVTDNNSCNQVDSVLISEPSQLVLGIDAQQDPLCNGSSDGAISTSPSGGTAPYSYVWSDGPSTAEDRINLPAGTYSATLTDANGCTAIQSITLTDSPVLTVVIDSLENVKCKGNSTGYARALASGGTSPYTYQWSNSVVGRVNQNIPAGSYTVTVTDAHNCTATTNINITEPANALAVAISKTDASCKGSNDGSATANPTGGTAPYTYNWGGGLNTKTINGLGVGSYTVTVTDNNGCTEVSSVTINQPTTLSVSINPTHLLCNNDNSGLAQANATGGTPPYTYLWSDNQNTQTAVGLAAGNYTVTVTDDHGCTGTANVSLTEPTALAATISSTNNLSCNGSNDGSATVSATGGTSPYTYLWNDPANQTSTTASALSAGNYAVTVTDANGCTQVANVSISQPNPINFNSVLSDVSCFGNADGSISISNVSGGTSPYSFSWAHGPTSASLTNLGPGNYTLSITDNNGCTDVSSFTIGSPSSALSVNVVGTNNDCAFQISGSATASASGGTPPYSYLWSNNQSSSSISNLSAGTYSVTVTDANSCQASGSYTVTTPSPISIALLSLSNPTCNGGNNGSISISASGGSPAYTFQWDDPNSQTTATASGLTAGTYTVTVTDANGCKKDTSITLIQPTALDITFTSTNVTCGSSVADGTANASVIGGIPPYSYQWSNAASTASISNLPAGKYFVTVTDNNNCTLVDSVEIIQSTSSFSFVDSIVHNRCFNDSMGRSDILGLIGGNPPYTYSWSSNIQNFSGPSAFFLPAGNYSLTISDATGCDSIVNFTINQPPQLVVNLTGTDANNCPGSATGTISSSVTGGVPPYTYVWSNNQTTANLNNIPAGSYTLTVTDAHLCQDTATVNISQPGNPIVITLDSITHPSCPNATDGSISTSASGGSGALSYQWNDPNSQTTSTASNLGAGFYSVTVTDANGCSKDSLFQLVDPAQMNINFSVTNVGCSSGTLGSATANVSGGTAPYAYQWSNSATTASINNLSLGQYDLTVTDNNGCTVVGSVNINSSSSYTFIDSLWNVRCFGDSTGAYYLAILSGGSAPYSFTWSSNVVDINNYSSASEAFNLPAGNYFLTISDAGGCDSIVNFTINEPPQLMISLTGTDASCPGSSDGSIISTVTGGVPPYTYSWSNNQSTANLSNITAGTYSVSITDANFCTIADTITISEPANEIFISLSNITNPSCASSFDGSISINATGGVGNLTYQWDDPNSQTGTTASGLNAGIYTVTVTDANGCSKDSSISLTVPNALDVSFSSTNAGCNPPTNGSATANVTGGIAPYTYQWSNSATTASISNLSAGTYRITVTDANLCSIVDSVSISSSSSFGYIDSLYNARCFGEASGIYTLFGLSGGTAPYSFSWSSNVVNFTTFPTATEASSLAAGNYSLTISDAAGCDSIVNFTITEPPILTAAFTTTLSQCGASTGTATVNPSGGAPPYSYNWIGLGQTSQTATGLGSGIYSVEVSYRFSCRDTFSVAVNDDAAPTVNLSAVNASCNGSSDGMAIASSTCLTAGTCSIEWLNIDGSTTNVFNDTLIAPQGSYISKVIEGNCTVFDTINIPGQAAITVALDIIDQNCGITCNGSVKATPIGGSAPYIFNWNPSSVQGQGTDSISALCKGTYSLTITDANGCMMDTIFTVDSASISVSIASSNISCHGANDGSISISPNSGTAPYTYTWTGGLSGANPTNVAAGKYYVTVTDANGCSAADSVELVEPAPLVTSAIINSETSDCFTCDGSATIIPTGGTAPYFYEWYDYNFTTVGISTQSSSQLCAVNYFVVVTDANACKDTVFVPIGYNNTNITYSITDETCNGSCNGSITVNSTCSNCSSELYDLQGNFVGSIHPPSKTFSNLCNGQYIIREFLMIDGCSTSDTITIGSDNSLIVSLSAIDAQCNGSSNGSITSTITDGTAPYTYTWTGGLSGANPTNIVAGKYFVTVTDANGCSTVDSVEVMEPDELTSSLTINHSTSCGPNTCNGTIDVTTSGGSAPYSYQLFDASFNLLQQTTNPLIGLLCSGDYWIVSTDANACSDTVKAMIGTVNGPISTYTTTDENCSGTCDGKIEVSNPCTDCGNHILYDINGNELQNLKNTFVFENLCAGSYIVRSIDTLTGCSSLDTLSIGSNSALVVTLSATDAQCNDANSGSITSSLTGGTAPYTYTWTGGLSGANPSNVAPGSYSVTVTDANGCSGTASVSVSQSPTISTNATITNTSCHSVANGSISLNPTGGSGSYNYNWSPPPTSGQGTNTITGLSAGTYFVTVSDVSCTVMDTFIVAEPASISVSFSSADATCGNADGSVTASVSGGTAPYNLQWFDNANVLLPGETNPTLSNVASGTYRLRVRDNNICEQFFSTTINDLEGPEIITDSVFNVDCFGGNGGEIYISANDPNQPLTYNWLPIGIGSQDVQNLAAGTYTVVVENSLGCVSSETFNITESPELMASFSKTDADCGLCNGVASISVSGGLAPYSYLWSNGETTSSIDSLCAGIYSVKVTDANNCSETFNVSINNSGGITGETIFTSPTCMNSCNGSATVNPIGGTPPYTYLWMHNGSTQNSLSNMCAGTYYLQITDFNSCTRIAEVKITGPSASLAIAESVTPSNCDGSNCDGSIFLNVSGGFAPYSYSWAPGSFADTNFVKDLCSGIYQVTVTDANGCSVSKSINVNSEDNINFEPNARVTDVSCFGACDGGLFSDHSITGQYSTQWLNDQGVAIGAPNTDIPTGVCAGSYTLMVTRIGGSCQEYHTVIVEEPDTIIASPTVTNDLTCAGDCDGEVYVSVLGGTLAYSYAWDDANNQTSNPAVGLCAGTYKVSIKDANGCTVVRSVVLNEPVPMEISINGFTGVDCSADCDGTADIEIQGGVAPYTFSWSGGQTVEDPTDLCYGENIITVTDGKGCVAKDTVYIPAVDTVDAIANADLDLCEADEIVLSGAIEGDNINNFGWYVMPSGNLFTRTLDTTFHMAEGTYQFALIANGAICNDTDFVNVNVRPSPSIDANGPMTLYEDESKQVTLSGKDISYIYDWTPGEALDDSTIAEPMVSARQNTTYIIIVSNVEGCTVLDSLVVKYYPELVINNGFTPNGDGVNDVWNIDFVDRYPNIEVTIFNRWGQEIFHSKGYEKPWDGKFEGDEVPVGTYYYIVDLKDEKYDPITGPLTIMR